MDRREAASLVRMVSATVTSSDLHEHIFRHGSNDMDETQLGQEIAKASTHSPFAVLALALMNPLSDHLRNWYRTPSAQGVRRTEPYSLGLVISAHGAQVHNPYGDSTGEQNPTGFVSPVCQLNTAWSSYTQRDLTGDGANTRAQEHHAAALIHDRRVAETVTSLAEEWQGSFLDLLEAAGELVKDTAGIAAS